MHNQELINKLTAALNKEAYVPPPTGDPAAGAVPPMDPVMAGMPMDPAMMGAPPMDPAMAGMPMDPAMAGMPMDPAMAGAPPMDPAMAGMPMDPAAMGMPPAEDPAAAGAIPVSLTMEDLEAILEQASAGQAERLDKIEKTIDAIAQAVNVAPVADAPQAEVPAEEAALDEGFTEEALQEAALPPTPEEGSLKTASEDRDTEALWRDEMEQSRKDNPTLALLKTLGHINS